MLIPQPGSSCMAQCKFESQACTFVQILTGPASPSRGRVSLLVLQASKGASSSSPLHRGEAFRVPALHRGSHFLLCIGHGPKSYFLSLDGHRGIKKWKIESLDRRHGGENEKIQCTSSHRPRGDYREITLSEIPSSLVALNIISIPTLNFMYLA